MLKKISNSGSVLTKGQQNAIQGGTRSNCQKDSEVSYTHNGVTYINQGWVCADGSTYTVTHILR